MPLTLFINAQQYNLEAVFINRIDNIFADCNDTSCSADFPPKTIPTRCLAISLSSSLTKSL
jgi:hypothetical protein